MENFTRPRLAGQEKPTRVQTYGVIFLDPSGGFFRSRTLLLLIVLCIAGASFASASRKHVSSTFLSGELGVVTVEDGDSNALIDDYPQRLKKAAASTLLGILSTHVGYSGKESIVPTHHKVGLDRRGNKHVRLKQTLNGYPIEGSSIVMHIDGKNGTVYSVNGEFHTERLFRNNMTKAKLDCESAVQVALEEYGIRTGKWESTCEAAAVQGRDGKAHLAYKRLRGYPAEGQGAYQLDLIFASISTGALLAVHPKVYGALALRTYNCHKKEVDYLSQCTIISASSSAISTKDPAANNAHNFASMVYSFYKTYFNRDSLDDRGVPIRSVVHYGLNYANAFYTSSGGGIIVFGDGDGENLKITHVNQHCRNVALTLCVLFLFGQEKPTITSPRVLTSVRIVEE